MQVFLREESKTIYNSLKVPWLLCPPRTSCDLICLSYNLEKHLKSWKIYFVQVSEGHTDNSTKYICSLTPCITLSGAEVGLPQSSVCLKKHVFPLYL